MVDTHSAVEVVVVVVVVAVVVVAAEPEHKSFEICEPGTSHSRGGECSTLGEVPRHVLILIAIMTST